MLRGLERRILCYEGLQGSRKSTKVIVVVAIPPSLCYEGLKEGFCDTRALHGVGISCLIRTVVYFWRILENPWKKWWPFPQLFTTDNGPCDQHEVAQRCLVFLCFSTSCLCCIVFTEGQAGVVRKKNICTSKARVSTSSLSGIVFQEGQAGMVC